MSGRNVPEEGGGFRWSFDEVKLLFRHPFSGQQRASARRQNANSTGVRSKGWIGRWSMDDLKNKFKSIRNSATGKKEQQDKKRKRPKLTPEEREIRRQERMKARREKKSRREKERRENVNELFGHLGKLLDAPTGSSKDKTAALEKAVGLVKEKQKSKKGGKKKKGTRYKVKKQPSAATSPPPQHELGGDLEMYGPMDDSMDVVDKFLAMDFDTDDGFLSLHDDDSPSITMTSQTSTASSKPSIAKRKR